MAFKFLSIIAHGKTQRQAFGVKKLLSRTETFTNTLECTRVKSFTPVISRGVRSLLPQAAIGTTTWGGTIRWNHISVTAARNHSTASTRCSSTRGTFINLIQPPKRRPKTKQNQRIGNYYPNFAKFSKEIRYSTLHLNWAKYQNLQIWLFKHPILSKWFQSDFFDNG